jgi:hypothetical protein
MFLNARQACSRWRTSTGVGQRDTWTLKTSVEFGPDRPAGAERMRATIHWKTQQEGGRSKPPLGAGKPAYAAVVRFIDSTEPWPPQTAWSLVVEKIPELSSSRDWVANVHFLVDEAPMDELRPDRMFELYEGAKCVASGTTVSDTASVARRRTA